MKKAQSGKHKLLIISNRLPITVHQKPEGTEYVQSAGGLATGLSSVKDKWDFLWIGWPGTVPDESQDAVRAELAELNAIPVFLSEQLSTLFYEGFSNRTLWPLFHSFPVYMKFSEDEWEAYREANERFADAALGILEPGDTLWIHDYQLLLLPSLIRKRMPSASIGYFHHIPFPPYDIFRFLPVYRELLNGMLSADLLGFHTHDYVQAFLGTIRRALGLDHVLGQIATNRRITQADAFPMGIDFEAFAHASDNPSVRDEIEAFKRITGDRKTVFSVSRLDYTKGIPQSLAGIERFFQKYPEWKGNVVFIFVVVPSRERVDQYAELKREIDETVGRINATFATLEWNPIVYMYRSMEFPALAALYTASDVAIITPLRDGMNLVCKEYLASRTDDSGVLILGDMAGASRELMESLLVNPNSREELADTIQKALEMSPEEQRTRNEPMRSRLRRENVHRWVDKFLGKLSEVRTLSNEMEVRLLTQERGAHVAAMMKKAKRRLFLLDYDGTLVPFAGTPSAARPDAELLRILTALGSEPQSTVAVISGRDKSFMEQSFQKLPALLVAEHGGWYRGGPELDWKPYRTDISRDWMEQIKPIIEHFSERIPGSFLEEKDLSLVWHYRLADPDAAYIAARDLLDTLVNYAANLDLQVRHGNKNIEIKSAGIGKGRFTARLLTEQTFDGILAAGDDWTDEEIFTALPPEAHTVRVGFVPTRARYSVGSYREIRTLLDSILEG